MKTVVMNANSTRGGSSDMVAQVDPGQVQVTKLWVHSTELLRLQSDLEDPEGKSFHLGARPRCVSHQ